MSLKGSLQALTLRVPLLPSGLCCTSCVSDLFLVLSVFLDTLIIQIFLLYNVPLCFLSLWAIWLQREPLSQLVFLAAVIETELGV